MRLASPEKRRSSAGTAEMSAEPGSASISGKDTQLSFFGECIKRPPSQKGLAQVLDITTRHLRRWETAEDAAGRPCSRPYSHANLWHLYQRRGEKGWNRTEAGRLGLAEIFERFDRMIPGRVKAAEQDERSILAGLMLRSLVADELETAPGSSMLPRAFGAGLADAGKAQLRMIVECDQARDILVKAFFEAALIADARRTPQPSVDRSQRAMST